jgi:hypothetical protein
MLKPSDTLPQEAYRSLKSFLSAPGFYRTMASDPPLSSMCRRRFGVTAALGIGWVTGPCLC